LPPLLLRELSLLASMEVELLPTDADEPTDDADTAPVAAAGALTSGVASTANAPSKVRRDGCGKAPTRV
jgi:hypothetical protein